jgi:hypothetical protein
LVKKKKSAYCRREAKATNKQGRPRKIELRFTTRGFCFSMSSLLRLFWFWVGCQKSAKKAPRYIIPEKGWKSSRSLSKLCRRRRPCRFEGMPGQSTTLPEYIYIYIRLIISTGQWFDIIRSYWSPKYSDYITHKLKRARKNIKRNT